MATLAALAVLAASCSLSDREPEKPVVSVQYIRPEIPQSAKTPCSKPVPVPDRDLTDQEVASGWGADRAALITCEVRRATGVAANTPGPAP